MCEECVLHCKYTTVSFAGCRGNLFFFPYSDTKIVVSIIVFHTLGKQGSCFPFYRLETELQHGQILRLNQELSLGVENCSNLSALNPAPSFILLTFPLKLTPGNFSASGD